MKKIIALAVLSLFIAVPAHAAVLTTQPTLIQSLQATITVLQDQVKTLKSQLSAVSVQFNGKKSKTCDFMISDFQAAQKEFDKAELAWRTSYNKISANKSIIRYGAETPEEHQAALKTQGELKGQPFLDKMLDIKVRYALACK